MDIKILSLRGLIASAAAASILTACSSLDFPSGVQQPITKSAKVAAKTTGTLIYVTDGCGGTCVLSYPDGKLVGTLNVGAFYNAGACTNSQGDVFISNNNTIVEFAHGGTSPIASFNLPGDQAKGCAVDPTNGNVAVVFNGASVDVAIFSTGSNTPKLYTSELDSYTCAFDASGNLFVAGLNDQEEELSELSRGGTRFNAITINGNVGFPGQLQWVGKYLTYESISKNKTMIYRLLPSGSSANIVGKTRIVGPATAHNSWIYNGQAFVPYSNHGPNAQKLGVWKYPRGGTRVSTFSHFAGANARLQFVVLSVSQP